MSLLQPKLLASTRIAGARKANDWSTFDLQRPQSTSLSAVDAAKGPRFGGRDKTQRLHLSTHYSRTKAFIAPEGCLEECCGPNGPIPSRSIIFEQAEPARSTLPFAARRALSVTTTFNRSSATPVLSGAGESRRTEHSYGCSQPGCSQHAEVCPASRLRGGRATAARTTRKARKNRGLRAAAVAVVARRAAKC